ncbi:MAG TPA: metallophosphoesterase [Rhodanobacteraceae bacterium]|nr:metallophosphoesterase [Rhodanobacteraceae bacterium]
MTRKTSRTLLRRTGFTALGLAAALLVAALVALSCAKVEMTPGGVHTRLLVPIVRGAIGVRVYAGTGDNVAIAGYLAGPVVHRGADGSWSARWFCEDAVHAAHGRGDRLQLTCAGNRHSFTLTTAPAADAVAPMPDQVAVLSDIEGNSAFLEAALRKLGVVDASGTWRYGTGHLVMLGDSVDRGREVSAVLWRLHELAAQAHAAGGAVHVLLGNHEQYLLRGNSSRAHPEFRYAMQRLGGYAQAFAGDTVLGQWLRDQPVVLKLGPVLFTHAGISPQVAHSGLSVEALNATMRSYWRRPDAGAHTAALDAVLGLAGVTQYRGYFRATDDEHPAATQGQVEQALARYGVRQIVVAHTLVEKVAPRYDGRVMAVDVNHPEAQPDVLLYVHGQPRIVDLGIPRGLQRNPPRQLREFSLFEAHDRELLASMYRANRRLGRIPYPY